MTPAEHSVEVALPLAAAQERWSSFAARADVPAAAGAARFEAVSAEATRVVLASSPDADELLARFRALVEEQPAEGERPLPEWTADPGSGDGTGTPADLPQAPPAGEAGIFKHPGEHGTGIAGARPPA